MRQAYFAKRQEEGDVLKMAFIVTLSLVLIASVACGRESSSQPTVDTVATPVPAHSTVAVQALTPVTPVVTPAQTVAPTPEGTPTPIPEHTQPVRAIAHCTGKSEEYWLDYVQQHQTLPTINRELAECYKNYIENDSSGR